ncbi:MAG: ArnT family glycosyltransferase [Chloroflexota bacterium]
MKLLKSRFTRADSIVLLLLLLFFTAYLYNLTGWQIYDDEGEYLYQIWRMVTAGEIPYRDFLTPQLPAFLYAGAGVMRIAGVSLTAIRVYTVLLAFASAGVLYLAGRHHQGPLVGILAAALYLIHPDVFRETRIFRNESILLLFVSAGLVISTWPREGPKPTYLAAAGVCFAVATLSKLFGVLPAAGVGLWLLWDWYQNRRTLREAAVNIAALVLPMALIGGATILVFSLITPDFLDLVLGHHLAQGSDLSLLEVLLDKLRLYAVYVGFYPVFIAVSLISAILGFRKGDTRQRWLWQIPTVAAFLVISRQFGQRHFMYLLPALCLLGAWLLADLIRHPRRRWLALVAVGLLAFIAVPAVRANVYRASWVDMETDDLVALIQERTEPGDTILADDIGLAYYSRRPTTYSGAALSHGAVTSGQITGEILIDEIAADDVRMVLVDVSLLTGNHMVFLRDYPRFHRFLEANFQHIGRFNRDYQEIDLWWREQGSTLRQEDQVDIEHNQSAQFGPHMRLLGYSYESESLEPGEVLRFTLFWTSQAPAERYWTVFAHLIGPDGNLVAQDDKVPYGGVYPPDRWWPGQVVDDDYAIEIPTDAQPGEYAIQVGMYDWQTGDRLDLFSESGDPLANNQLRLDQPVLIQSNCSTASADIKRP